MQFSILHIIIALNIGGAELMLKRLIEHQQNNSPFQHTVISLMGLGRVGLQLQDIDVRVITLNMRSTFDLPRVFWQLIRLIRKLHPDIVQTWMYHADLLGGVAARLVGNRNVIWGIRTTNITVGRSRTTYSIRKVCAALSHFVPHAIVCNAEASRKAHIDVGYDASRMIVVPNGFDLSDLVATPEQRAELRTQCGFTPDSIVIGSIGRFNAVKDHNNFIHAAGLLAPKYPHVHFLMVGRDLDNKNADLVHMIFETGYPDRFLLLGERTDVAICLAAMDIFCMHSRTEGFPNVVGEAMAMGLPCLVTDVGDAAMLVADTGYVVPKEDSIALAQGLDRLLIMNPKERMNLGQKAKIRIISEFNIECACERFATIYQKVLKREIL